ncbi:uncharacterized protein LOC125009591 [Mugil cephalus]|uniref:uncharacterized protein LOC125009591 n=1 Tax=Mugil cephalus TaxID=48193 RepID=UPI001FB5B70F|nr:uncharacterized protein LOC125009591 [Mugil cephalus]
MAGLCWMVVTVTVLVSTEISSAVDQNQLKVIVQEIQNRYRPSYVDKNQVQKFPMFSVAVTVPYNNDQKTYDMTEVHEDGQQVRDTILKCRVYTSSRVVAATVLRWPNVLSQCPDELVQWPHVLRNCKKGVKTWADVQKYCPEAVHEGRADHAEYRILQNFNSLITNRNRNDLLVFYVRASPCPSRCTRPDSHWNILTSITQVTGWDNYAVVFSDIFKPRDGSWIAEEEQRGALERLATDIGLKNIFRCYGQGSAFQCTSCSEKGSVNEQCYKP